MGKITNLEQFEAIAASASTDASVKASKVAAAASAAIKELAAETLPDSDTVLVKVSANEPADDMYWAYFEDIGQ